MLPRAPACSRGSGILAATDIADVRCMSVILAATGVLGAEAGTPESADQALADAFRATSVERQSPRRHQHDHQRLMGPSQLALTISVLDGAERSGRGRGADPVGSPGGLGGHKLLIPPVPQPLRLFGTERVVATPSVRA